MSNGGNGAQKFGVTELFYEGTCGTTSHGHPVDTITPSTTFGEALRKMRARKVWALVVVSDHEPRERQASIPCEQITTITLCDLTRLLLANLKKRDISNSLSSKMLKKLRIVKPLNERFGEVTTIQDLMEGFPMLGYEKVQTVASHDPLATAVKIMLNRHSHQVIVCDNGDRRHPKSVITQLSLLKLLRRYSDDSTLPRFNDSLIECGLARGRRVYSVTHQEPVLNAFQILRDRCVSFVAVVDPQTEHLLGQVSVTDVQFMGGNLREWSSLLQLNATDYMREIRAARSESTGEEMLVLPQHTTLSECVDLLGPKGTHAWITDDTQALAGVITAGDILRHLCFGTFCEPISQTAPGALRPKLRRQFF